MNLVAKQNFGRKSSPAYNTEIGGVSGTITTASALATTLGISVGNISNFTIVGSDIKCKITGSYSSSGFANNSNITYWKDEVATALSFANSVNIIDIEALAVISNIPNEDFKGLSKCKRIILPNLLSTVDGNIFTTASSSLEVLYLPSLPKFGTTSSNNSNFINGSYGSVSADCFIYVPLSQATVNSGGVEGDLADAIVKGMKVKYVSSILAPDKITGITTTIYNTAVKFNFTPPSSTNVIQFYEAYSNGRYIGRLNSNNEIIGLTPSTSYVFNLVARDINYNGSPISDNIIFTTTSGVTTNLNTNLVAYYKLDETSGTTGVDSKGTANLTVTGLTLNQTGKIGTSFASTASGNKLTGTVPAITGNFSINIWAYRTGSGVGGTNCTIAENGSLGNGFGIWTDSGALLSWRVNSNYNNYSTLTQLPLNTWTMITMTWDGSNIRMYINAVLKREISWTTAPNSATTRTLFDRGGQTYIGRLDENAWYNVAISQAIVSDLYNGGAGITL